MFKLLLLLFVLVSACVAIHGLGMILGLRWLGRTSPQHGHHFSLLAMFWINATLMAAGALMSRPSRKP